MVFNEGTIPLEKDTPGLTVQEADQKFYNDLINGGWVALPANFLAGMPLNNAIEALSLSVISQLSSFSKTLGWNTVVTFCTNITNTISSIVFSAGLINMTQAQLLQFRNDMANGNWTNFVLQMDQGIPVSTIIASLSSTDLSNFISFATTLGWTAPVAYAKSLTASSGTTTSTSGTSGQDITGPLLLVGAIGFVILALMIKSGR